VTFHRSLANTHVCVSSWVRNGPPPPPSSLAGAVACEEGEAAYEGEGYMQQVSETHPPLMTEHCVCQDVGGLL
jgi:hypothetical protein